MAAAVVVCNNMVQIGTNNGNDVGWNKVKVIGGGSFGTVSLAKSNEDQVMLPPLIAVKSAEVDISRSIIKETRILFKLKNTCPYIIKNYGDKFTTENGERFYNLLLEYAPGGSLADRIRRFDGGKGLPEQEVRGYLSQIVQGLKYIHDNGYVHCDIKPHNILICEDNTAKIADFGLSKKAYKKGKVQCELRGTPLYMAPESIMENEYEPPCDVWALGCVVFEMLSGERLWKGSPENTMFKLMQLMMGDTKLPTMPSKISERAKDFIDKCLEKDSKSRWTVDELLKHPFLSVEDCSSSKDTAKKIQEAITTALGEVKTSPSPQFKVDFPFNPIEIC